MTAPVRTTTATTADPGTPPTRHHATHHPLATAPRRVGGPRHWWDWVLAADPGLGQLQAGWRSVISMIAALAVGYGMSVAVGLPAMLGMIVGGMMGLMSAFAVAENTAPRLARAILWMPFPFSAVLPLSAALSDNRPLELSLMGFGLALTFFLARFGTLYLLTGMMMFNSFMVGMMAGIPVNLCFKAFLVALVSCAGVLVARLVFCYPMPREDLLRTQRAFVVEARRVADAAVAALDPDADHDTAVGRMRRSLRRLNMTTVIIDGRLAQPEVAADPGTAELLHRHLFDAEIALQGIGQAVQQLTRLKVTPSLRETVVVGLVIARDTPLGRAGALRPAAQLIRQQAAAVAAEGSALTTDEAEAAVLAERVGRLLDSLAESLAHWLGLGLDTPTTRAKVPFQPTIALEQNRPAGTGAVARRLADAQDVRGWRRLLPYLRLPLHAGVAVAIVMPISDAIDPSRFYWGLVGVMITLFGTNTTHDRVRKFGHRMVGTAVGAVIGIVLLHLIGPGHVYATLAVIVGSLAFGAWGMQRAYALWAVGLVTALVQLYGLTTPYSGMDHLLAERLLDNAIGIAVATACAALIFPVSNGRLIREAERGYTAAIQQLITQIVERWKDPEAPVRLRGAARGVDAALFQIQGVARPLIKMPIGVRGPDGANRLALLTNATGHARALAAAADTDIDLAPHLAGRIEEIMRTFTESLGALDRRFATGGPEDAWVRIDPLVCELESELGTPSGPRGEQLGTALRELKALDETLAGYAQARGLKVVTAAGFGRDPREAAAPVRATMPSWAKPTAADVAETAAAAQAAAAQSAALRAATAQGPAVRGVSAPRRPGSPGAQPGGVPTQRPPHSRTPGDAGTTGVHGATAPTAHSAAPGRAVPPAGHAVPPTAGAVPSAGQAQGQAAPAGAVSGGRHAAPAPEAYPATGAVTVTGTLRCVRHPDGCDAWITVVSDRGKRRAGVRAVGGRYRIDGLEPGRYTLIAAGAAHGPRADYLSVRQQDGELRHDIDLDAGPRA
ncbi:FUSC family protein [Streptomyces tremellae]|uniref:Integral membrane bound transporter domain-containing protein n=1 Tax=Streptomyces tremellae TaxID=1124239 RepID=A0ABP7FGZ3_9ACTN